MIKKFSFFMIGTLIFVSINGCCCFLSSLSKKKSPEYEEKKVKTEKSQVSQRKL